MLLGVPPVWWLHTATRFGTVVAMKPDSSWVSVL